MADKETEAHRVAEPGVLRGGIGESDSSEQRKAGACRDLFVISGGT